MPAIDSTDAALYQPRVEDYEVAVLCRSDLMCSWALLQVDGDDHVHYRNMQVDRSNAERAADSEKLMAGIRSRAAGYGSTAGKTTGRLE